MKKEREILYYENYFIDFFMSLEDGAKKKVSYVLDMLKTQERLNKMNIMQANPKIGSMDAVLDKLYGKVGSPEREEFRKEAYAYCVGQMICDARKQEKMTQSELAEKVGTNKTYISRIEKGVIEPGVGLFFRIIDALGLKVEIVKPIM